MSSKIEYTCKGKGGRYEILGLATGAGLTRGEDRLIYKDASTGRLFLRTESDFSDRMERLQDVAAPVVERKPMATAPQDVKRYSSDWYWGYIVNDLSGAWAKYDDHAALISDLREELAAANAACSILNEKLQATIAQLTAENERLKGGRGEPVAFRYVHRDGRLGGWYTATAKDIEHAIEGVQRGMWERIDFSYAWQPAPKSVALTDEQILEAMRPAIYRADGGYVFDTAKDDVIAAGRSLIDKVKELNQ